MAYNVSALPAYTDQTDKVILQRLFTDSPILNATKGNLMTGVKGTKTINIISNSPYWQAAGCGAVNPSGSTVLTQRAVTTAGIKIEQSFCEQTLQGKFTETSLVKGQDYTSLTFNTEIVEANIDDVSKKGAIAVWQGNTSHYLDYLNKYDGLIKIIDADIVSGSLTTTNTYSGTAWSEATSRTVIKGICALIIANQDVYKGGATEIKMYMSPAMVAQYKWKRMTDNVGFDGAYGQDGKGKLYAEGTTIEIVEDPGLAGITKIYALEASNVFPATDGTNEQEKMKVWYSNDDNVIYLRANWRFGINVAFVSRCFNYLGV